MLFGETACRAAEMRGEEVHQKDLRGGRGRARGREKRERRERGRERGREGGGGREGEGEKRERGGGVRWVGLWNVAFCSVHKQCMIL